ncbi:aldo/keto reductase [Roseospira visakhapatnamensis]|uniref:Aryl-alcohol dehydrogenase-like predicted oxidoreductase n=1 Tax=Roseospira visakhapatnamensis TaxID=390880 RepID=A0A7W6R9V3_9PROT|nr:aldo/keto reductase [Roseospira visakhapatnamensis]MBB4264417.1 aryl-alcohol dehydrogenase-like predicted oxidoreductase [Roseospira visakhapatnamensis]
MNRRHLGQGLDVSALGLGCMGMSEFYGDHDDAESLRVLNRAADLGITFLDTADMYGPHHNERLLGTFLKQRGRAGFEVATKCGIVRTDDPMARSLNSRPDYIRAACDASLQRLGIERIDLYYLHRYDGETPIEDVMGAFADLKAAGKIAHVGLSEVKAETLRAAHAVHPVTALQTEYSLWTRDVEAEVLPACRALGIGFVPYSPLGRGYLTGAFTADTALSADDFRAHLPRFQGAARDRNQAIVDVVRAIADEAGATPAQVAIAWVLSRGEHIVPIPGTKRVRYLEDNVAALTVSLSGDMMRTLDALMETHPVAGARYTPVGMATVDG